MHFFTLPDEKAYRKDTQAHLAPGSWFLHSIRKRNKALWKNGQFQDRDRRAYFKMSLLHHVVPKSKKVLEKQKETCTGGVISKRHRSRLKKLPMAKAGTIRAKKK